MARCGRTMPHGLDAGLTGYVPNALIVVSINFTALIPGFSIEDSEVAAVPGFAVLRSMLRLNSINEVNIVQTVASAGTASLALTAADLSPMTIELRLGTL